MMGKELVEVGYLRSARAVRERAEYVLQRALAGDLEHFEVRLTELPRLAARVAGIVREAYPDLRQIPIHGRYRHFVADGVDRLEVLDHALAAASREEQLATRADLVLISVLLDAGAGNAWSYREPGTGRVSTRSEGLAIASFDWFMAGGLSARLDQPLRADAERLRSLEPARLERAFQVGPTNPLVGVDGRVAVLRRLGEAVVRQPTWFGPEARPGGLLVQLLSQAHGGELRAEVLLHAVLETLSCIWPGREELGGVPLGDVWTHSRFGRVPFHKLAQWLTYSLFEPLEQANVRVLDPNALTGLAEYRNGGLFLDGGVLHPRDPTLLDRVHEVGSDVVIEWRALTLALLDRMAEQLRFELGLSAESLPLPKVLEGGTWRAGRILAAERRPGGGPPLQVLSDGTVF